MALRVSGEGEPDGGLAGLVAVDADRDVADEPSAGLDADLESYAGLG